MKSSSLQNFGSIQTTYIEENKRNRISKITSWLFMIFSAYMVIPLVDVPLLGLSLSAPIFFIIAAEAVLRPPFPWFRKYQRWITHAVTFWIGIILSVVGSGFLSGGVNIDNYSLLAIIRYAYWMLVFIVTVYLVSTANIGKQVVGILGLGVFLLALLRLLEVFLFGNIGAWTGTQFMSQNNYGFLFSTFSPFLLAHLLSTVGFKRLMAALANICLWGAVLVNGSRGSWIGVAIGLFVFFSLLFLSKPKAGMGGLFVFLFCIILGTITLLYSSFAIESIETRFSTFLHLDQDKSYVIRQVMNQKALLLFDESPLVGVGPYRFTKTMIDLELPNILRYGSQSLFNSKSAHNSYLSLLAETGLVGIIPFGFLLLTLFLLGFSSARVLVAQGDYWGASVFAAFISMSSHMWAISALTNSGTWFQYGLVGAMIVTAQYDSQRGVVE